MEGELGLSYGFHHMNAIQPKNIVEQQKKLNPEVDQLDSLAPSNREDKGCDNELNDQQSTSQLIFR
jgi:hypothetical protein